MLAAFTEMTSRVLLPGNGARRTATRPAAGGVGGAPLPVVGNTLPRLPLSSGLACRPCSITSCMIGQDGTAATSQWHQDEHPRAEQQQQQEEEHDS